MVGGLQILVGSIRELLTHSTLSATDSRDLLMHIVKALSAAAVGHGMKKAIDSAQRISSFTDLFNKFYDLFESRVCILLRTHSCQL